LFHEHRIPPFADNSYFPGYWDDQSVVPPVELMATAVYQGLF